MSMNTDKNGKHVPLKNPTYEDGRTKQTFKDETDINKILARAQKTGTISHINQFQGSYGDFSDFDFFENTLMLTRGREIFDALPSELRNEFQQNPSDFFQYVNDPANKDRLEELLPGLAAPGRQNIDVMSPALADIKPAPADPAEAPPAAPEATLPTPPATPENAPTALSGGATPPPAD